MLKKLRHKSVGELWFRARHLVEKKLEKLTFDPQKVNQLIARIPAPESREAFFQHPARQAFFFFPERDQCRKIYREELFEDLDRARQRAEEFYQLQFNMLGAQFSYTDRIAWHVNPATGKTYEKRFYQDITIFVDDGKTDIKHVWEINRHQFFIELAKGYFLTQDEKYARRVVELFEDWVAENPYKIGVNWTSALEAAVRVYSWTWSLFFLADAPQVTPEFLHRLLQQVYLHGRFIRENLSYYFSPYNHLIGELSALNFLAQVFPELPESQEWEAFSWKALVEEMPRQFHPDGIIVEQATFYHHFTLGFYLMPALLKQQQGYSLPDTVQEYLQRSFQFNMMMTRPDGTFPSVGDIDNARSIYFREPEQWDFRNVLAIGAQMFQRSDWKWVAGRPWEEVLWFFGASGWGAYQQLPAKAPENTRAIFPQSGYGVARSQWDSKAHFCWMDFGEMADGIYPDDTFSAAHGHADILHFEITAYGKNFLIDSGFHNYRGNFEWHRHFRLTRAHNTIEIDGHSQATHGSRMMLWANVPQAQLLHQVVTPDLFYLRATHNGFDRLPGSPRHIRNFFFLFNTFWVVWDELLGSGFHQVDAYLHFNADTMIELKQHMLHCRLKGEQLLIFSRGVLDQSQLQEGGEHPEEGWISPLYRHPQPAPQVTLSGKVNFPAYHCLGIVPVPFGASGQWKDHAAHVQLKDATVTLSFDPRPHFSVDRLFFVAEYEQQSGGQGVAFGKRNNRYVLIQMKKDDQQWTITGEEYFEA